MRSIVAGGSGARSAAAAFARACSGVFAPGDGRRDGIGHEDPAQRHLGQRGAGRDERAQLVDERQARLVVDARERLADVERFAVPVEAAMVRLVEGGRLVSLPVSRPDASGTRARTPTSRRAASARKRSAGRWRTMLKMIWTVATPGNSMALSASSTRSTLTP